MGNEFSIESVYVNWPDEKKREFRDTIRDFYELAKTLDPTRPILSNDGEPRCFLQTCTVCTAIILWRTGRRASLYFA